MIVIWITDWHGLSKSSTLTEMMSAWLLPWVARNQFHECVNQCLESWYLAQTFLLTCIKYLFTSYIFELISWHGLISVITWLTAKLAFGYLFQVLVVTTHEGAPREFLGAKVIGSQRWLLLFFFCFFFCSCNGPTSCFIFTCILMPQISHFFPNTKLHLWMGYRGKAKDSTSMELVPILRFRFSTI